MINLVHFILCAYGLTFILVYGSIFDKIRPKYKFFHCPLCVGFWVGVFLWSVNGFTELFIYDYNYVNALLLGCLSAGTSYALTMLIDDCGLKISGGE